MVRFWIFTLAIGALVEFLLGFCMLQSETVVARGGRRKTVYNLRYDHNVALIVAACSAVLSVVAFVKYNITIPSAIVAKWGIFILMMLTIVAMIGLLYIISVFGVLLVTRIYGIRGYTREDNY